MTKPYPYVALSARGRGRVQMTISYPYASSMMEDKVAYIRTATSVRDIDDAVSVRDIAYEDTASVYNIAHEDAASDACY